jgi:DNA-binding response OmpR family regulator
MLPDSDGIEICKYLKNHKYYADIPVIMLTAKADEMDKVLGLEIGADDYVTKPFSLKELIARAKAALRKTSGRQETPVLSIGDSLKIDASKYEVYEGDKKVELTTTEFKILSLLAKRKGRVYSREEILEYIGVAEKGVLDRTVDVHIKNLREKLGPEAGKHIKNIRGVGYKIEE